MSRNKVILFSAVDDELYVYMPLSIMALGTVLDKHGFDVVLLDIQVDKNWRNLLQEHLKDALLLGVSCYTGPSITVVLDSIEIARNKAPEVPIVWGGYHATLAYRDILDESLVDYVVKGVGEYAILNLAKTLYGNLNSRLRDKELQKIPNLVYRSMNEIHESPTERLADMNDLPSLNYNLIDVEKYFDAQKRGRPDVFKREIPYISSYGCPYACTFCGEPRFSGRLFRPLNAIRVVDEITNLWEKYSPTKVAFADPNFSSNPERVIEITEELHKRGKRVKMLVAMRAADIINIAKRIDISLLRKVGFEEVFIGVESGSDRMLKSVKKGGQTAKQVLTACRLVDAVGIQTEASFIHDLPGETEEDTDLTFQLAEELCKLSLNRQSHHFFIPFPSTEIYDSISDASAKYKGMSQREWAETSTFYGSTVWKGNMHLRKQILRRLLRLKEKYPRAFPYPVKLPVFQPMRASKELYLSPAELRGNQADGYEDTYYV